MLEELQEDECDLEVQGMEAKPWRSDELRNLEDGLPWLKEGNLESSEVLPSCHGSGRSSSVGGRNKLARPRFPDS